MPLAPTPFDPTAIAAIMTRALHVGAALTENLLALPADTPRNPAADYALINRAMRQAVLVLERLAAPADRPVPAEDRAAGRTAAREQVIRAVEDVIHEHARDRNPDALRAELIERLHADAMDAELDRRPVAEIVGELCRDLNLVSYDARRFKRRTPADIAALKAAAAGPASQRPPPPAPPAQPRAPAPLPQAPSPQSRPPKPRPPLSTPSLILPRPRRAAGTREDTAPDRPEAGARDQR